MSNKIDARPASTVISSSTLHPSQRPKSQGLKGGTPSKLSACRLGGSWRLESLGYDFLEALAFFDLLPGFPLGSSCRPLP